MSEVLRLLREIVRDELQARRPGETAVVTGTGDDADGAYVCDVALRHSGLEFKQVPICTPHAGLVSNPRVGDLVLLAFVGGDVHRPLVIGRVHSDKLAPPERKDDELWLAMPPDYLTKVGLREDGSVLVAAGETTVTIHQDGDVEVAGEGKLSIQVKGDVSITADGDTEITCGDATIKASGDINLGEGGGGVITDKTHKCYFTGAPLVGSATVKAKG